MLNEVLVRQRQGLALPHSSTVLLQPRQHQPRSTPRAKRRCCAISPHQWRAGLAGTASATQPSFCHVPSHRSVAHLGRRWRCTRKHHLSRRRKPESPRRNCWELLLPQPPLSRAQTGPAVALKHCHVLPAAPRLLLLSQSQPRPRSTAVLAAKFSVKTITPQSCPAVMNTFHPVTGCTLDICNTALPGVSYSPSCSERQTQSHDFTSSSFHLFLSPGSCPVPWYLPARGISNSHHAPTSDTTITSKLPEPLGEPLLKGASQAPAAPAPCPAPHSRTPNGDRFGAP